MFTGKYSPMTQASFACAALIALVAVSPLSAQTISDTDANHTDPAASGSSDLATELQALRVKVGQVEAALKSQHQSRYGADTPMPSMSSDGAMGDKSMGGMKMMGGMKDMKSMSKNTDASSKSSGMSMDSGGMGMGGMGMKKKGMGMMSGGMMGMKGMGMMGRNPAMKSDSMSSMNMPSALPGFPGASHLYHIGETGLFLDHPQHITLSSDQQQQLNKIKESALLATASAERGIDEAEQQLWQLTAAAQPDINKIEAKAKEIASLNVSNRIEFIRAVGKAAEVLNEDQRQTLVGMANDAK